ncbi:CvpA family protein [Caldisericum exile]|uniref:CvpA family protein n=1 Tax=Caldisericum exile (strain DSM 21853 / NBRC 104410 / AZM16c01) TaxID=511051 RepID=A0A7U6GEF8_CALEA|nr:CvpA family protein [Caldisericum exile]BAL80861.1 hypothetical protein CSE_07350 [Caldisericum exile AZM16c01]
MNTNYVDIFVFALLLTEFFVGINRGAILFIFDIIGIVLGVFLSNLLAPKLSLFLNHSFHLDKSIAEKIQNLVNIPGGFSSLGATFENVSKTITNMHLPKTLENFILANGTEPYLSVKDFITLRLSQFLVNAISYVLVFVIVILIVRIVALIIRQTLRVSPFLRWIDIILGGVLRVALSLTIIAVVIHMLGFVFSYLDLSQSEFFKMLISSRTYYISETYFQLISNYLTSIIANFK